MDFVDNHDVDQCVIHLDDRERAVRPRRAGFECRGGNHHALLQALQTSIAQSIFYALAARRLQSKRFAAAGGFLNNP
jgi:hypothetical protein